MYLPEAWQSIASPALGGWLGFSILPVLSRPGRFLRHGLPLAAPRSRGAAPPKPLPKRATWRAPTPPTLSAPTHLPFTTPFHPLEHLNRHHLKSTFLHHYFTTWDRDSLYEVVQKLFVFFLFFFPFLKGFE